MRKFNVVFLLIVFLFLPLFVKDAHAQAIDVFLDPSSGEIVSTGTDIDIVVNANNQEYIGMNIHISYSGPIEYVDLKSGNIGGCSASEGHKEGNEILFYCFILTESYTGNGGVFATLNFKSVGDGSADVNIESVDADLQTNSSGGRYTAVFHYASATPSTPTTTTTTTTTTELPDSSLSNHQFLILGSILLSTSIFILIRNKKVVSRFKMQQKVLR